VPLFLPSGFGIVATTGDAGFALENGTPTILSWEVPNDGQLHSVLICGQKYVTATETGGTVIYTYEIGGHAGLSHTLFSGGNASGTGVPPANNSFVVDPGSTVSVSQSVALTGGASIVYFTLAVD
jgi:hypothetical protein